MTRRKQRARQNLSRKNPPLESLGKKPGNAALRAFGLSRLLVFLSGWGALSFEPNLFGHGNGAVQPLRWADGNLSWSAFPRLEILDALVRWDSGWYWRIVSQGYEYVPGHESSVAFFPAYPLLAGALSLPLRWGLPADQAFYVAALCLSNALFAVALIGVERLGRLLVGEKTGRRAVWLMAFFPFSFFFSAAYTESMFLAATVWSVVLAKERRWGTAGLAAMIAGATRSVGLLIVLPLLDEFIRQRQRGDPWRRPPFLWLGLAPLGLAAFMGFQWLKFGNPLAFIAVQANWGHTLGYPLSMVWDLLVNPHAILHQRVMYAADLAILGSFAVLAAMSFGTVGWGMTLYATAALGIPLLSGLAEGTGRYSAVVFPFFLSAAKCLSTKHTWMLCAAFVPLLVYFLYYFAHWSWPV